MVVGDGYHGNGKESQNRPRLERNSNRVVQVRYHTDATRLESMVQRKVEASMKSSLYIARKPAEPKTTWSSGLGA